jgi:hypothetical protein
LFVCLLVLSRVAVGLSLLRVQKVPYGSHPLAKQLKHRGVKFNTHLHLLWSLLFDLPLFAYQDLGLRHKDNFLNGSDHGLLHAGLLGFSPLFAHQDLGLRHKDHF